MAKKLIVANWKLNPKTAKAAVKLARLEDFDGVVIAPPMLFVDVVGRHLKRAVLGVQDIFWEEQGPYTGAVSAAAGRSLGVKYVIVGHSERRRLFCETDAIVNRKVAAALKSGLKVILCVGEMWNVRRKGLTAAKNFVKKQLTDDLKELKLSSADHGRIIVAYEPVWAIGTGKNDDPKQTAEVVDFIRKFFVANHKLKVEVIYGGSVTPENASGFAGSVDGALVGGASLRPADFSKVVKLMSK
jgi:triosephosphate isomerase (TIM)